MVLDIEKKRLRSAPLGGEPRTDDIEGLAVTDKAILIHGTGKREGTRKVSRKGGAKKRSTVSTAAN